MKTKTIFSFIAIILVLSGGLFTSAQNTITNGTYMIISSGTTVVSSTDLAVNSGGNISVNGTLKLMKDFKNLNGSPYNVGTGTVEFDGSTGQNITGQNIIQNLTVNNSAGLTLGGNTTVNGNLSLSGGRITLGSNNLQLGPSATVVGSPSSTAMVVPEGTGELRKEFPATGSFTYPVGDASGTAEYSPVTVNYTGGTFAGGNYTGVSLKNIKYPDANITDNYLNRYWNISESGITNPMCNTTFQYLPADVTGTEILMSCTMVNPAPWTTYSLVNAATHQLSAQGMSTYGAFTGVKSFSPPPNQQLSNIDIPSGVTNCYDATQILTVGGNGTSFLVENGGIVYLVAGQKVLMEPGTKVNPGGYVHAYISTGPSDYCNSPREVAVTPENETVTGSVALENGLKVKIWPNPTPGNFTLEVTGMTDQSPVDMTIYDMQGRKILTGKLVNEYRHDFSIANQTVGIYNVRVFTGNNSATAKIIKTN
jgi:hypothetical protein